MTVSGKGLCTKLFVFVKYHLVGQILFQYVSVCFKKVDLTCTIGLCNVSTTSHHNPDAVLNELTRALMFKVVMLISFLIWCSEGNIGNY